MLPTTMILTVLFHFLFFQQLVTVPGDRRFTSRWLSTQTYPESVRVQWGLVAGGVGVSMPCRLLMHIFQIINRRACTRAKSAFACLCAGRNFNFDTLLSCRV